ncbi:Y-family DNA polymerase [Gluconobacter cerinus]|uniref:Nucleotidyltransferase n=1 Tax=Gluconobacter cerinus TaxID=38307 RepID=A0AAV5NJ54_9PROT|nr:DNA polymerase Y family protein [Gluconobacter cerinus]GLQ64326.1 nucleotidyltransferase [Gluconobacter cerinus]
MRRFLALWMPFWRTERLQLSRPGNYPTDRPLVVHALAHNRHTVTGVSPAALAAGLTPGMPLAQARSLVPDLLTAEEDAEAQRAALTDLCSWLIWLSPLPAFDAPDGLYSDTTGCAHLYGGEATMLDLVRERLQARGHSCSVALSDTAAASRALARSRIDRICLVPPGQQKQALRPLPCSALPLPEKTISSLTRLGLNTIGALADLPRAPLAKRFGAQLLSCLDEALGRQASPLSVFQPADRISLTRSLVEPISTPDAIATVIAALVPVVCEKLTARGEGARQLDFLCVRVDGSIQAIRVGTSDPTADVTRLTRLLRDQIAQIAPEFGIETVILTVSANEPLEVGPERSILPDVGASSEPALPATLIDRLLNRPGVVSVHQLAPRFSAWPEDGQSRISPGDVAESTNASQMLWARPNILFDLPVRVQVTALHPDGAPRQFVLKRQTHRIAAADGPERLLGEWWQTAESYGAIRDYWQVETTTGLRLWLFRKGDGAHEWSGSGDWFLQGVF